MVFISVILEIFHIYISGNDISELHSLKIRLILIALEITHFDKSGNDIKELHLSYIFNISNIRNIPFRQIR